jgi:undecaprenyl diphosphate synthase
MIPREIQRDRLPEHVGIIMDGNGRWAETKGLPRVEGHRRGAERAKEIIRCSRELGIKTLTLYTFSIENWQRPQAEISVLMKLLELYLEREMHEFRKEGISFKAIGETWLLPKSVQTLVRQTETITAGCTGMKLLAALSYGGRNEILRAVKRALSSGMREDDIDETVFSGLLDTAGIPDPDLIIRTSGEKRISNFLLWQCAYSELYFTDTLWPDFGREEYLDALGDYQMRDRRFGTVRI